MLKSLRSIVGAMSVAAGLLVWLPGCSNEEPAPAPQGKMSGGAMEKDKMGGMEKDKMSGGAMEKDKMGGMEKGKMSGGAMEKDKMGGMEKGKMEGTQK